MDPLHRRLDELKSTARFAPRQAAPRPTPALARLEDILGGREASCGGLRYWFVETPFGDVCEHPVISPRDFAPSSRKSRDKEALVAVEPDRTMLLDIETGGFAGVPVFLIGLVPLDREPLCVVQLLARDYPEEEAILRALAEIAAVRTTWVTFNGKSFDEPFLRDRATLHRVALLPPQTHVDLLPLARRRWRQGLPNHRLGTLEQHVLNRRRVGDVPSSDVPDLFHHFMRTGNAAPLRPVLEHNRLDLVSAMELLVHLVRGS